MMKCACTITLLLIAVVTFVTAQDVNLLLQNRNLVDQEIGCVLKRSPCDLIGQMLIRFMPAIVSGCGQCSPQQAANANALVTFMKANYPREYSQIVQMYGGRSG